MDEPPKMFNRTPIEWVPELPGDRSVPIFGHSPLCCCEECRLKEAARFGSADNPLVTKQEPPRS